MKDRLIIFDTTMRDGEQSPGASMTREEKVRIARQLERLRVDVIEAGFPAASNGDFEAVRAVANVIKDSTVAGLCRANDRDIGRGIEALKSEREAVRAETLVGVRNAWFASDRARRDEALTITMPGNEATVPQGAALGNGAPIGAMTVRKAISVADASDANKIFTNTTFNGDGVIIPESAGDDATKAIITDIAASMGTVPDRSGKPGIDQARTDAFFAEAAAFEAALATLLEAIADASLRRKIGARGLRMIIEDLMLEIMYALPGQKKVKECVITREVVEMKAQPITLIEKAG